MKLFKIGILGVFLATLAALAMSSSVFADQGFDGPSYFQGSYSTDLIRPGTNPTSHTYGAGYVMPNRHNACGFGGWCPHANGDGAVGWKALGYSSRAAADAAGDQDRKLRLYCFLENRNGRSTKRAACSGWSPNPASSTTDWEKMGSAVVVYQLLGRNGKGLGNGARTVSTEDWDDLYGRLMNQDLRMRPTDSASNERNTSGVWANGQLDARDYWFSGGDVDTVPAWVFSSASDGSSKYRLEVSCANGLGGLGLDTPPPPDVDEYSLTPTLTEPASGSIKRGGKITAKGKVQNVGDAVNGKSWYITRLTYSPGNSPSNTAARNTNTTGSLCNEFDDDGCTSKSFSNNFTKDGSASGSMDEFTVPDSAAVDTRYCFVVSVRNPTQVNDSPAWRHSAMNCVTVKREFVLVPAVESVFGGLSDDSVVDPGESGTIQYSLENTGKDTSTAVEWRLTHYVYLPDSLGVPSVSQKAAKSSSTQGPCEAFPGTGQPLIRDECTADPPKGWTSPSAGITVQPGPSNKRNRATGVFTVPADAAVGTKYCWVASVSPPTMDSASGTWSHSDMLCIVVGKEPKIQVWGGDVRSGGGITTSMSTIQNKTYGSWVEYAALSKMQNIGLASGAGLNKGNSSNSQASWSTLTFANTGTAGCAFGCYSFALSAPTITGQFMSNATNKNLSGTVNINGEASGVYRATGGVSLSGTTISAGKTIIIDASGPVTILGSITYEDKEYRSARELPQLIIKAPTINIRNEASQVDAWLLAVIDDGSNPNNHKGVLNTCSNVSETADLTDRICNRALTVNGPVVADIVHLRRTAGSGSTEESRGDPAEIFNLRADAYMWASAYGSQTNQIHTVHSKELSPRF